MAYIVKATLGNRTTGRRRVTSRKFKSKRKAQSFADLTNNDRPGSNARVSEA